MILKNHRVALGTLMLIGTASVSMQARFHLMEEDPFFDWGWADQLMDFHIRPMHARYVQYGPSKEDVQAMNTAHDNLAKIILQVTQDKEAGLVTMSFSGFEGLEKKDVEVEKKNDHWVGSIRTKNGRIDFVLTSRGIQVTRFAEMKRETKQEVKPESKKDEKSDKKVKDTKEAPAPQEHFFYSSSSVSEGRGFSPEVNISTLKALPVEPTKFMMTVTCKAEPKVLLDIP